MIAAPFSTAANGIARETALLRTGRRATPRGRVALLLAAIRVTLPDTGRRDELNRLHRAAFPSVLPLGADTHIALDSLMPPGVSHDRLPGALIRAAEDRLSALTHGEEEAA